MPNDEFDDSHLHPQVGKNLEKQQAAWFARLMEEEEQTRARVNALTTFTNSSEYNSVSVHEQGLLMRQLSHMKAYLSILTERVKLDRSSQ